ncbi:hypothetical protein [Spirosoma lituiforme]
MTEEELFDYINRAAQRVLERDSWLLKKDLSERSISHKLAEHLQALVVDFDVDCEYNGNAQEDDRKKIYLLNEDLRQAGFLREEEAGKDPVDRAVFPDIIVHKRGSHEQNMCVIEVKKSTSRVSFQYDRLKLMAYTSHLYGNELSYQLGVFVCFQTNSDELNFEVRYFREGEEIN